MSMEQARALIDRMKSDESFCKNIFAIEDVDTRWQAINAAGYTCTTEEMGNILFNIKSSYDTIEMGGKCFPVNKGCGC